LDFFFDGSKSNDGAGSNDEVGACFILKNPNSEKTMLSCRLEFQCTNNVAEYKVLIQGLKKDISMNVQEMLVFGDSEIVVK
jgi:ribonuclease HI